MLSPRPALFTPFLSPSQGHEPPGNEMNFETTTAISRPQPRLNDRAHSINIPRCPGIGAKP